MLISLEDRSSTTAGFLELELLELELADRLSTITGSWLARKRELELELEESSAHGESAVKSIGTADPEWS